MKPEYINSDLELRSKTDISGLVSTLSRHLFVPFNRRENTKYLATFEIININSKPDTIANRFCKVIENLSAKDRAAWKKCLSRNLDLGFQSGHGTKIGTAILSADTIGRLAKLNINIAVSVYPIMKSKITRRTSR